MRAITKLFANALAIFATAYILEGVYVSSFVTALIVALVLAGLNILVKPLLVLLTLPITILTLGLFMIVINIFVVLLASRLVEGFVVDGYFCAFLFSFVSAVLSSLINAAISEKK